MMAQLERVFVYGTLKRGQPNHLLLVNVTNGFAKFIGDASTLSPHPLVIASDYNIPFILPFEGKGKLIHGELYDVDETMLQQLDKLEQHPFVYKRQKIPVTFDGTIFQSWCYILQRPKPQLLDLKFIDNYDFNKLSEEKKYVKNSQRRSAYPPQVMEPN